jgi:hypothetical protein
MKTLVRTLGLITAASLLAAGMTLAAPADKMGGSAPGGDKMAPMAGTKKMATHHRMAKRHKMAKHHKMAKKGSAMSKGMSKKGMSKKGMEKGKM